MTTTPPTTEDTTPPPPTPAGVWVFGSRDYYWTAQILFPGDDAGKIAALSEVNTRGYGEARFVPFGVEGAMS